MQASHQALSRTARFVSEQLIVVVLRQLEFYPIESSAALTRGSAGGLLAAAPSCALTTCEKTRRQLSKRKVRFIEVLFLSKKGYQTDGFIPAHSTPATITSNTWWCLGAPASCSLTEEELEKSIGGVAGLDGHQRAAFIGAVFLIAAKTHIEHLERKHRLGGGQFQVSRSRFSLLPQPPRTNSSSEDRDSRWRSDTCTIS